MALGSKINKTHLPNYDSINPITQLYTKILTDSTPLCDLLPLPLLHQKKSTISVFHDSVINGGPNWVHPLYPNQGTSTVNSHPYTYRLPEVSAELI